ncbi:MAG TPA: hypothetical protein VHZ06_08630 [Marmoricola sp.]|nr:hypothetical protein [Marmoricola sp.]
MDFAAIQQRQLALFEQHHPDGDAARVSQGLVVIPTDTAAPEQRAKYTAFVYKRTPRTAAPIGPPGPGLLAAPDTQGIGCMYGPAGRSAMCRLGSQATASGGASAEGRTQLLGETERGECIRLVPAWTWRRLTPSTNAP